MKHIEVNYKKKKKTVKNGEQRKQKKMSTRKIDQEVLKVVTANAFDSLICKYWVYLMAHACARLLLSASVHSSGTSESRKFSRIKD